MDDMLEKYFAITDRNARYEILKELRETENIDQELVRVLEYLWKMRYDRKIGQIVMKDAFLDSLMQILAIDNMLKSGIGWKHLQKQVFQISEVLGLEDYRFQTQKGETLFVREYKNLAMYFYELGENDRCYRSRAFRIGAMEDEKYNKKILRDFNVITDKVPREFGFSAIFLPLKKGMDKFTEEIQKCMC